MYCRFCGRETGSDKDVCEYCLNAQKQSSYNTADSAKYKTIIAVLVAVILTGSVTAGIFLKSGGSSKNTGSVSAQSSNPVAGVVTNITEASSYSDKTPYTYQGKTTAYSSAAPTSRYVSPTRPKTTTRTTTAASTKRPQVQPDTENYNTPEPSGTISLTDSLQYDLNIFLSNFSESKVPSFSDRLSDEELADYGLCYNFINRQHLFETPENGDYYEQGDVYGTHRIKEHYVIETIKKYFDVTVSPGFAEGTRFYSDGYFYIEFTGAPFSDGFTVVSSARDIGGNLYEVNFSIYMSDGNDKPYYGYSTRDIENTTDPYVRYVCDGTAYIRATNIYDRSTYILDSYYVSR
ncbi:MAG: hypothetical protein ACI4XE_10695 [Acutalibacteraceae bacterium]